MLRFLAIILVRWCSGREVVVGQVVAKGSHGSEKELASGTRLQPTRATTECSGRWNALT